jgi:hypothetical protein
MHYIEITFLDTGNILSFVFSRKEEAIGIVKTLHQASLEKAEVSISGANIGDYSIDFSEPIEFRYFTREFEKED